MGLTLSSARRLAKILPAVKVPPPPPHAKSLHSKSSHSNGVKISRKYRVPMGGRNDPSFLGLPGGQRNCPQSREVDRQLTKDKALDKSLIKILILGIGGAGKSTLMKQLRLLHGTPPSRQERELMTEVIHRQIILTIQILVKRVGEFCLKENPFVD